MIKEKQLKLSPIKEPSAWQAVHSRPLSLGGDRYWLAVDLASHEPLLVTGYIRENTPLYFYRIAR